MVAPTPPAPSFLSSELRHEIERWFVRRGVPQLIEGYSSEPAMDSRAAPWISIWLLLGTIKDWGTRPDWPLAMNAFGVVATLAWMALLWAVINRLRGRPVSNRPTTFDLADILIIALLPAVPAALIDASAGEALTSVLGALTGIGAIYVIIGFGIVEIGAWAFERLLVEVTHLVGLAARTLPLLLILVVFLLFGSEIWQVAHAMTSVELGVVLLLLFLLATVVVVTAFRRELSRLETGFDRGDLLVDTDGTPVQPLVDGRSADVGEVPPLTWLQRGNLTLLGTIPQILQVLFVALVVMTFLVVFGVFAIPESVQAGWIGEAPQVVARLVLLGEARTVSTELLIVSAVLGAIVGLYFSGLAISEPAYRSEQFDRDVAGVRKVLAVRAVYLDALRRDAPLS